MSAFRWLLVLAAHPTGGSHLLHGTGGGAWMKPAAASAADAQATSMIWFGKDVSNNSSGTNLFVRKNPQQDNFCIGEATYAPKDAVLSFGYGFLLGAEDQGCSQSGFSFAPSTSPSSPVPAAGASITLGGVEIALGVGRFVASGFEGFTNGQSVVTEVTFDMFNPAQTIIFKIGPYRMKFSKDFDAANFLRYEGETPAFRAYVLCMFGNYTPLKLCGGPSQPPCTP
jgi:hypothetical protein